MDIYFATAELAITCSDSARADRRWGRACAKVVKRRLTELQGAETLFAAGKVPAAHLHELTGDREGQLAVNAKDGMRIILEPADEPVPRKPDGGLDWHRVTAIRILEITNYHRG